MTDVDPARESRLSSAKPLQYIILFCATYWVVVAVAAALNPVIIYTDYPEYINLVAGRISAVNQPFAGRILAPAIARLFVLAGGVSAPVALGVTCAVGWAIVPILGGALLWLRGISLGWALVVASLPFPALSARFFQVPDAWPICLVLVIFLAVETQKRRLAGFAALGLAFARATSILAVALQLLRGRVKDRWDFAAYVFTGFYLGVLLKWPIIKGNAGNKHKMSSVIYMLSKVPVNALSNIFGLHIYTNTFPYCERPPIIFNINGVYGFGNIHNIGLCPLNYKPILITIACYLFVFGAFPFMAVARLLRWWAPNGGSDFQRPELAIFLIMFLLCPTFGLTIPRLFVEAYPLLFLAVAAVTSGVNLRPPQAAALIGCNLCGLALLTFLSPN